MRFLYRPFYRLYRLILSTRAFAQRRFTGAGLAVLFGLIATATMGVDTDNTVAYQAFAPLSCMLLVAICFSRFRSGFSATRLLPQFATAGRPFGYSVHVRNLSAKTQNGLTLLEDLADPKPSFEDWLAIQHMEQKQLRSFRFSQHLPAHPFKNVAVKEALVPPIPSNQETAVEVELTPLRRGVLALEGLTIARTDPLGLVRAFKRVPLAQTVLVLPKRYLLPPIALPGMMKYQQGGIALASNVGQSEEFVALRDYRHGDPLRHIHWRSWARAGKPVVKEFEDEFFVRHALVLDTFVNLPYSELLEEAVSVAASFACTIQTQESLLDLLFVGPESHCFTAGRGLAQADQMLEVLASVRPCREKPFGALEHLVLNHVSVVSGCICVMLAWDQSRRDFVAKLKALGLPVLVLVIVEPGQGKDLDPGPMRDEPEKLCVLEIGKIEEGLAKLT